VGSPETIILKPWLVYVPAYHDLTRSVTVHSYQEPVAEPTLVVAAAVALLEGWLFQVAPVSVQLAVTRCAPMTLAVEVR